MLPTRTEPGYWMEKNLTIKNGTGRVTQIVSLAIEVTETRKLEENFRKFGGELLWNNKEYRRLARELHSSINEYRAALGMSLDRLSRGTRDPEKIPELLTQSTEFLDERMQKLGVTVAKCFAIDQQH